MKYPKYCRCIESSWGEEYNKLFRVSENGIINSNGHTFGYVTQQFVPITQLEYIKSINLKEALIKLANTNNYQFKSRSKEEAKRLDKLFYLLNHTSYKNSTNNIENYYYDNCSYISFALDGLHTSQSKIELTFNNILDYV